MPEITEEYAAARRGVALFDRSALGKVTVTGRDRLSFLQGMLTNDVKALARDRGSRPPSSTPTARSWRCSWCTRPRTRC